MQRQEPVHCCIPVEFLSPGASREPQQYFRPLQQFLNGVSEREPTPRSRASSVCAHDARESGSPVDNGGRPAGERLERRESGRFNRPRCEREISRSQQVREFGPVGDESQPHDGQPCCALLELPPHRTVACDDEPYVNASTYELAYRVEDMGNDPARDGGGGDPLGGTDCAHPTQVAGNAIDLTNSAEGPNGTGTHKTTISDQYG